MRTFEPVPKRRPAGGGSIGRVMLLAGGLVPALGCAGTTTLQAPVSDAMVEAEQRRQRELVLRTLVSQQARLDDVAFPLLESSVEICGADVSTGIGVRWTNRSAYEPGDWRRAAVDGLGLTDTLTVLSVASGGPAAEAGLRAGDRVLTLDGARVPRGPESLAFARTALEGRTAPLAIGASGPGGIRTLEIRPVRLCAYEVSVGNSSEINAYADGERVVITTGMMRFADDLELAVVVGHEIAHNAMDHISAMRSNALWGALAGALLDGLVGAGGADSGDGLTQLGADAGASRFSQDFEREADYVGLYVLARAGVELGRAPEFWRHMAIANPGSIGLASSHPTSAERFVRLEQALAEIDEKRRDGRPLLPEMRPGGD